MVSDEELNQGVRTLLYEANRSLDKILDVFNERCDVARPVILAVGEYHDNPYDKFHQLLLMRALRDNNLELAIGQELPHNNVYRNFRECASVYGYADPATKGIRGDHPVFNQDKTLNALKSEIVTYPNDPVIDFAISFFSMEYQWQILNQNQGVKTYFNDCSWERRGEEFYIDLGDPLTHSIAVDLGYGKEKNILARGKKGIHIRNAAIVQHINEHIGGIDIYLLPLGDAHVTAGQTMYNETAAFAESVPAMMNQSGCEVLMMPKGPVDEQMSLSDSVHILQTNLPYVSLRKDERRSGVEDQYRNRWAEVFEFPEEVYDYQAFKARYDKEIEEKFKKWTAELEL